MLYASPEVLAAKWFKRCRACLVHTVGEGRRARTSPRLCKFHKPRIPKVNALLGRLDGSTCLECGDTWEDFFGDACQHCCPHSSGFDHGICIDCEFDRT